MITWDYFFKTDYKAPLIYKPCLFDYDVVCHQTLKKNTTLLIGPESCLFYIVFSLIPTIMLNIEQALKIINFLE